MFHLRCRGTTEPDTLGWECFCLSVSARCWRMYDAHVLLIPISRIIAVDLRMPDSVIKIDGISRIRVVGWSEYFQNRFGGRRRLHQLRRIVIETVRVERALGGIRLDVQRI